ncbi:MAG: 50S ribosomal protein L13 [Parcubacteria group bacterium]|jgi:large subunit ribosomal protein L13
MERKYHSFDLKEKAMGRLATQIAKILSGRNKVDFTPHIDGGDFVVVANSDELIMSGGKEIKKLYHKYSGYPGGIKTLTLEEMRKKDSRKIIREAVYGMLPKNKLRDKMIKRLFIYKDDKFNHKIDIKH